jgi:hypothetical protein
LRFRDNGETKGISILDGSSLLPTGILIKSLPYDETAEGAAERIFSQEKRRLI